VPYATELLLSLARMAITDRQVNFQGYQPRIPPGVVRAGGEVPPIDNRDSPTYKTVWSQALENPSDDDNDCAEATRQSELRAQVAALTRGRVC
jgi:hypothetical protein